MDLYFENQVAPEFSVQINRCLFRSKSTSAWNSLSLQMDLYLKIDFLLSFLSKSTTAFSGTFNLKIKLLLSFRSKSTAAISGLNLPLPKTASSESAAGYYWQTGSENQLQSLRERGDTGLEFSTDTDTLKTSHQQDKMQQKICWCSASGGVGGFSSLPELSFPTLCFE